MNASKHKKNTEFLEKSQLSNFKEIDAFKLFEFLEQIMIGAFLITGTQLEKTGSIGKVFIPLGSLKNKFHFRN